MTQPNREWYHCSSYGIVMLHLARYPSSCIREIADALCLSSRTVWGTVDELERCGQVISTMDGRTKRYCVNPEAPMRHPTVRDVKVRHFMAAFDLAGFLPGGG